ncbi:MAG TPA: SHOCT domain-containing protein, partial [Burkholderiales bacterium]|nr:SHOCT domain-containing protein [Burkholderiales bacterium]
MGVEKLNVAMPKRLILAASVAAICAGLAAPAQADMETLLDKLRAKGVLSEEEYQEMRTEARAERREK